MVDFQAKVKTSNVKFQLVVSYITIHNSSETVFRENLVDIDIEISNPIKRLMN